MNRALRLRFAACSAASALGIAAGFAMCDADQRPDALGLAYATGWAHDENSGDGASFFSARTFVDCAHTRVGYRQSADIFTGAYSHAGDGRVRSYADLGVLMQNDTLVPGRLARPDKVQLYGQASTQGRPQLLRFANDPGAPQHAVNVACDTPLLLVFYVASPTELVVRYTGTFVPKHGGRSFTGSVSARITGFVPADGWSARCDRCAVRRVNTLAVSSGPPTRSGAYFGIRDRGGVRAPAAWWKACVVGKYTGGPAGDPRAYRLRPFNARRADIVNAPAAAETLPPGRPRFLVRGAGTADVTVGLDQR